MKSIQLLDKPSTSHQSRLELQTSNDNDELRAYAEDQISNEPSYERFYKKETFKDSDKLISTALSNLRTDDETLYNR